MSTFTPSAQQAAALKQIKLFLASPGSGVFILKGYAGTGKTTLLQQLALELRKEKKKFVLLAPTGRAATVLKSKTGLDATTIHSELYAFSDIDGELAESNINPAQEEFGQMRLMFSMRKTDPIQEKLYIADEASMISDDPGDPTSYAHFGSGHLLSDLLHIVGTNKIIFSGDPSQLPPVSSAESPALSEAWMRKQGKVVQSFELKEILRQKQGSGILQLATRVRTMTQQPSYPKWIKLPATGFSKVNLLSYHQQKELYIRQVINKKCFDNIAICNSNLNCSDINKSVRMALYQNSQAPLQVYDILMITQNNHLVPLTNGDFVEVTKVGATQQHLGIKFIHVTVKAQLTGLEHETLLCEEVLFNGQSNLTSDQQRMLMIDFSRKMRSKGIKPKSEAYFTALQKDPYLNSLRANFGYAVTCHKSQGGEWENVYLFLHKGMYAMPPQSLSRWWYTGITRAKEQLYLVSDWWIV
ncbi:MAG: AAA family ATPase [Chitinophagaceae bacterium]|nr:AAA family ATPase [Chitinophagaceae bacterium]